MSIPSVFNTQLNKEEARALTHKRCQLQKDETRLRGERDVGKWWKEMEVVFGKGQEKREEREKRRQTQARRGIQGGDWEGQVSRENSHKNSSCVSSRKSPSTV